MNPPSLGFIGRTYRHVNRYAEILSVLTRHGFSDVVSHSHFDRYFGVRKHLRKGETARPSDEPLTRHEHMRLVLEELGTTFIKLGQLMSNRPDLLPPNLVNELEKLQDHVPPISAEKARAVIEAELGKPVDHVFRDFVDEPLASASIAQVHKAVRMDGREVAIKVQRPDIKQTIETDIEIMYHLASLMEHHLEGMDVLDPVSVVREFERTIIREMDFMVEAAHAERFRRNFEKDPTAHVPTIHRDLSTGNVLTMEYIDGIKISNITRLRQEGYGPHEIGRRGVNLVLKQVFEHGFFHADPHPGNLMVMEDNVVCFLDFGMVGEIRESMRRELGSLIIGIVNRDPDTATEALLAFAENRTREQTDQVRRQVAEMIEVHCYKPLKEVDIGEVLNDLLDLLMKNHLHIPSDLYMLIKALIVAEGVGRALNPDFLMVEHMEPFARKLMRERISPIRIAKDMYSSAIEGAALLRDLPGEMREIISLVKEGKITIEFEHKGLEPMLRTHDQISNRIVFAIVLAALIIGSSLIVLSGIAPRWNDIPVIGIVGYLVAGVIGFWLLISILRHNKM